MTSFNEYLDGQLKDPRFKAEYDALEGEFAAIQSALDAGKEAEALQEKCLERGNVRQTG